MIQLQKNGGGNCSPPPRGTGRLSGWFRPDRICARLSHGHYLALLRVLVAPLIEEDVALLVLVPEDVVLVPIFALLRHAPALPVPIERLYFPEVFPGSRRLAELALVVCDGLVILFIPRLAPFLFFVDFQRKSWLPRLVKREPSIPVEPESNLPEDLVVLTVVLAALIVVDLLVTVILLRDGLTAAFPVSLTAALFQRPSISLLFFIAHPSKSSDAEAGRAAATSRSRNNGTIDTLM